MFYAIYSCVFPGRLSFYDYYSISVKNVNVPLALRTSPSHGKARADAREKFVASFLQERGEEKRPPRGAAAFFRVVGQQADTRPVWASKVTTAPLFNRSVACSAPVMTGLSIAKPAMAAWEFAPLSSVMMPEQRRR